MSARKICIVGLDSYGLLSGEGDLKYIGGETVQHVLLARAWRDLGHDVSMIVYDDGQGAAPRGRRHHRDRRALAPRRHSRACGSSIRAPPGCLSALIGGGRRHLLPVAGGRLHRHHRWFCRMTGRKFIFRVASDSDCEKEHGRIQFWRDRKLFDYGLRARRPGRASQTEFQAQMLRENHGLECDRGQHAGRAAAPQRATVEKDIDVLWVSNLRALKRPELVLELARQLPEVNFTLAGGPMPRAGETYFEDVKAAAARLPNVTMPGAVRYTDSGALVRSREDIPQHLEHRRFSEHLPAGLDPRRAGGQLLRSGRADAAACSSAQVPRTRSTTCASRSAACSTSTSTAQIIGRRAREFAAREFTTRRRRALHRTTGSQRTAHAAGRAPETQWPTARNSFHEHPRLHRRPDRHSALALAPLATGASGAAHCATRSDVLFVLNNLGIGGSERKIARLANRLKDEGVHVTLACLNGPYTLESAVRRDVPLHKLERRGKFSFAAVWRLRRMLVRERPATVIAVNLYQALYVALRDLAAAVSSAHRGAGEHLDVPRPPAAEAPLPVGAVALRSDRARLAGAAPLLVRGQLRRAHDNSTVIYNGVDSDHFEPVGSFEAGKRLRASLGVKPESLLIGTVGHVPAGEEPGSAADRAASPARGARRCAPGDRRRRAAARRIWRAAPRSSKSRIACTSSASSTTCARCSPRSTCSCCRRSAVESFSNAALEAMSIGPPGDPVGHRRRARNDRRRRRRLRGVAHGTRGATAGDDRGAVCRPAQAPADGRTRRALRAVNCFSVAGHGGGVSRHCCGGESA